MAVEELVSEIDKYLDGKLSYDELEDYTMGVIGEDDFSQQDDRFQDLVYALDNKKLNHLNDSDIKRIRDELAGLINTP